MKILIAEDDATSRTMLHAMLSKWGCEVIVACDGKEAYAALQEADAPRLAVLDWKMPGMEGPVVCQKLRELEFKNPLYLILLTSKNGWEDIVHGLEAGADDYISKPYNSAELRARLKVGRRMMVLQKQMREREKLQGILETAGAFCHELSQPLQAVSGFSELLLLNLNSGDPNYKTLKHIMDGIERIGEMTHKFMNITRYNSKPYLKSRIIDIEQAS